MMIQTPNEVDNTIGGNKLKEVWGLDINDLNGLIKLGIKCFTKADQKPAIKTTKKLRKVA